VTLRFDYVTDAAVNGEGLLLDDVSVPKTGYASDFEQDDGGWQAAGFVRIQNVLPQTFRVSLITLGGGAAVSSHALQPGEVLSLPVSIRRGQDVVMVVSGTARFTRMPASYRFSITP
jgi:3-polyprenyl-4-hydroxybenzoate decarboxylase